jgi:hypothetical protein
VKSNTTYTTTTTTTHTSSGYDDAVNNNNISNPTNNNHPATTASNAGCVYAMGSSDFNTAKGSVEKQSFAEEKMKIAKQITKSHCLSAAQVKEMMSLFSFEENKLDYAKYAYDYTVDKDNYYQVNDAFSFSSSVDTLNAYLEGKK